VAFEITKQEIIKQAIALNTLWKQTRDQKYRDEELRLRRIALDLENTVIGGTGVTQIVAGTGVTISPAGGTGNVTINATATTPDLQDVTDEGNTTTNAITVGGLTSNASSTIVGAAAGTIGTRVLTVEGSLPEIWFKDTFAATDSFVLSKYGSLFYFARTSSTGAFINYAGAISPSGASWSFGHGGNPTATVHIKGADVLSSTKTLLVQNSSPTDLLTIWNDGAVGINTSTNAGYKLDVNGSTRVKGSGTTSSTTAFRVENANASGSMVILDNGNVGININTPGNKLTVYAPTQNYPLRIGNNTANVDGSWSGLVIYNSSNTGGGSTGEGSAAIRAYRYSGRGILSNELEFRVGGTPVMRFNYQGYVGIGTTTPAYNLDVNGTFRALLTNATHTSASILQYNYRRVNIWSITYIYRN
jgi:hypothetical protein